MTRRALPVIAVVAVVGLGLDLLIGYSPVIGYGAGIGLFGTILLTIVAKQVMAPALQRSEDYYPEDASPEVEHDVHGVRRDLDDDTDHASRSGHPGRGEAGGAA